MKAAGATIGALDLDRMANIVETIVDGEVRPRQLKNLLKGYIPHNYSVTPSDVCNIRTRALKYSIERRPLDDKAAHKLIGFKPLAADESVLLVDDDVSRKQIAEFLRQVLQTSDEGWKALSFLSKCKASTAGFDFRIDKDEGGRPVGICWMTNSMRKAWVKLGTMIHLDAMKRKMSLHWPYIGPVALDHEFRVVQLCESLCLGETFDAYRFALQSLESMEPRRKLTSIRLMYADQFLSDEFLVMVGLERPGTTLAWDSFHLKSKVWPEYFGQHIFSRIQQHLCAMLYGKTRSIYDEAYGAIAQELASDPAKLQYVKELYDHPERFAAHYISNIHGNLEKTSSQAAESNHSSVVAQAGRGSTQDIVYEISSLLNRQTFLAKKNGLEDAKYEKITAIKGAEIASKDASEAEALKSLSKHFYDTHWATVSSEGKKYTHSIQPDGSHHLHRTGTAMTSARTIRVGERCQCSRRIAFEGMCEHEYALHGYKFVLHLFPDRMLQGFKHSFSLSVAAGGPGVLENDQMDLEEDESASLQDNGTSDECVPDAGDTVATQEEGTTTQETEEEEYNTSILDNPPAEGRPLQPVVDLLRDARPTRVPYSKLTEACSDLLNIMSNKPPKLQVALYSSVLQLIEVGRGESTRTVQSIADSASLAAGASLSSTAQKNDMVGIPVPGAECNKVGRPRTTRLASSVMAANGGTQTGGPRKRQKKKPNCSFCHSSACGNIQSCKKLKDLGRRISKEDLPCFRSTELGCWRSVSNEAKLRTVWTTDRPLLQSLPATSKWLVLHGLYNTATSAGVEPRETDVVVEVSCYGAMGGVLEGLAPGAPNFDHRVATFTTVTNWVARHAEEKSGKYTRLIVGPTWKGTFDNAAAQLPLPNDGMHQFGV